MATPEEIKKQIQELREEFVLLEGGFKGVGDALNKELIDNLELVQEEARDVVKSLGDDLVKGVKSSNTQLKTQQGLLEKAQKGQNVAKEVEKELAKVQKEKATFERKINAAKAAGAIFNEETLQNQREYFESQIDTLGVINDINTEQIAQKGITGNILENAKEYLSSLDKSGLSAKLLGGELNKSQKTALVAEAALLAIANAALAGSDNINNLQKNLGISYGNAYELQNSLALSAANTNDLIINSKDLNKSLTDLVETTGLLSTFSGDTLVTMTTLTKQLGFGAKEASQLSLLSRLQSEDTNSVLENTVGTVNAINRQNKSAISAKAVLNDIATASASIVVSLGSSPELLAEAATEARALGLNLEKIDAIAASLLNFESSIENELKAELLLGKEINLEKARLAALNNDSAGLTREIKENTALIETFATGNRIQQQAAADAIGLSRNDLADMVLQQQYMNIAKDDFIAKYGEQSYLDMQSQSAAEKFQASLEKIQGIIGDIGTIFAPIIDGFAALVGFLAENKNLMIGLAAAVGTLAIQYLIMKKAAIQTAIADLWKTFSAIPGGFGIPLAIGATAALLATTQKVKDGIAPSSKGPFTITDSYGAMAVTAQGDSIMASPNITNSATSAGGSEQSKTNALLERLLAKDSNVYMDSDKVGSSFAKNASF